MAWVRLECHLPRFAAEGISSVGVSPHRGAGVNWRPPGHAVRPFAVVMAHPDEDSDFIYPDTGEEIRRVAKGSRLHRGVPVSGVPAPEVRDVGDLGEKLGVLFDSVSDLGDGVSELAKPRP